MEPTSRLNNSQNSNNQPTKSIPTAKKITVRTKGMRFLIFSNYLYILVTIGIIFGMYLMYKQLQNINHYLSQNSSVNISKQIQFDCQATALLPQNCR